MPCHSIANFATNAEGNGASCAPMACCALMPKRLAPQHKSVRARVRPLLSCRDTHDLHERRIQAHAIEPYPAGDECEPARGEPAHGLGVDDVFARQHTRCKARIRIVGENADPRLQNDRSRIELRSHEVNACAVLGVARSQYTPVRVQAAVERQQGWMDVQHPPRVARDESRRKDTHETCEEDEFGRTLINSAGQFELKCRVGAESGACDDVRGEPQGARGIKAGGGGLIGDDPADRCVDSTLRTGLRDRHHIGAAAGYEYGKRQRRAPHHSSITTPRLPLLTAPITCALSPWELSKSTAACA